MFLSGQADIEGMERLLKDALVHMPEGLPELHVRSLYGSLPPHEQLKVFERTPEGSRKVWLLLLVT